HFTRAWIDRPASTSRLAGNCAAWWSADGPRTPPVVLRVLAPPPSTLAFLAPVTRRARRSAGARSERRNEGTGRRRRAPSATRIRRIRRRAWPARHIRGTAAGVSPASPGRRWLLPSGVFPHPVTGPSGPGLPFHRRGSTRDAPQKIPRADHPHAAP